MDDAKFVETIASMAAVRNARCVCAATQITNLKSAGFQSRRSNDRRHPMVLLMGKSSAKLARCPRLARETDLHGKSQDGSISPQLCYRRTFLSGCRFFCRQIFGEATRMVTSALGPMIAGFRRVEEEQKQAGEKVKAKTVSL